MKRNRELQDDRRSFLKTAAALGGSAMLSGSLPKLMAQVAPQWKNQIGLELYTVRRLLNGDYEGVLAKLAEMGYKEVEPADPYNNMEPAAYKALLDKYGLKMYSTHSGATDGPDLEKQLEGQALMGIKYTTISAPRGERAGGGAAMQMGRGQGAAGAQGGGGQMARGMMQERPTQSVDDVKRECEQLNKYGAILQRFGMKNHIHNHAGEFELLSDGQTTQYDVYLAETDPDLVAMQIDVGWAYMAGQDPIEMFKKNPGRYELWHVKDATCTNVEPGMTPNTRARQGCEIVTMAEGEIDYGEVFANAGLAGLKYFVIEQDTAGQGGRDALEDCRIAYDNLYKILS